MSTDTTRQGARGMFCLRVRVTVMSPGVRLSTRRHKAHLTGLHKVRANTMGPGTMQAKKQELSVLNFAIHLHM